MQPTNVNPLTHDDEDDRLADVIRQWGPHFIAHMETQRDGTEGRT
jgi:hypothetical protein